MKTNPWGSLTVLKDWLCEYHMGDVIQSLDEFSDEELLGVILSIRSIKPTPVAEALTRLPQIQQKVWDVMMANTLANFIITNIMAYNNFYNQDWVIRQILNRNTCCRIGRAFQQTDFWQTRIPEIRAHMKDLKKIDGVMGS